MIHYTISWYKCEPEGIQPAYSFAVLFHIFYMVQGALGHELGVGWSYTDISMALERRNEVFLQRKALASLASNITNNYFKYNGYHKIKDNQVTKNKISMEKQKQTKQ